MKHLWCLHFLILCLSLVEAEKSHAETLYTLSDVRGESKACEQALEENNLKPICQVPEKKSYGNLDKNIEDIDIHLATDEIKREVITMAESQVTLSLGLLQKMGIKDSHSALSDRLKKLENAGIKTTRSQQKLNPDLLDKYLIASLRYYDLKRRKDTYGLSDIEKKQIDERVKLLEVRYPLITQHNFMKLKDFALPKLNEKQAFPRETSDDSRLLDNFLFNDTPAKLSAIDTSDLSSKSLTISAVRGFKPATEETKEEIRNHLKDDLQKSLASQLGALSKIESFGECELLTLHSQSAQQAINSSVAPDKVFKKLCECRKANPPINDSAVMGMGVASLGGLLLCITPTGFGQMIGCPTAVIAGWGATGASAVNFADSLGKYNNLDDQGRVVAALPKNEMNQKELELIKEKESELVKNMTTDQMTGLIGLGVGHVGFSGLAQVYKKSKLALSLKKLNTFDKERMEKVLAKLEPEEQTKAFVILDKIDDESREILLANPNVLLKELKKGERCEL
jgi:hypothetical protein